MPLLQKVVDLEPDQLDDIFGRQHRIHGDNRYKHPDSDEHPSRENSVDHLWQLIELQSETFEDRWQLDDQKVGRRRCSIVGPFRPKLLIELDEERIANPDMTPCHDAGSSRPRSRSSSSPRRRNRSTNGAGSLDQSSTMLAWTILWRSSGVIASSSSAPQTRSSTEKS